MFATAYPSTPFTVDATFTTANATPGVDDPTSPDGLPAFAISRRQGFGRQEATAGGRGAGELEERLLAAVRSPRTATSEELVRDGQVESILPSSG